MEGDRENWWIEGREKGGEEGEKKERVNLGGGSEKGMRKKEREKNDDGGVEKEGIREVREGGQ